MAPVETSAEAHAFLLSDFQKSTISRGFHDIYALYDRSAMRTALWRARAIYRTVDSLRVDRDTAAREATGGGGEPLPHHDLCNLIHDTTWTSVCARMWDQSDYVRAYVHACICVALYDRNSDALKTSFKPLYSPPHDGGPLECGVE